MECQPPRVLITEMHSERKLCSPPQSRAIIGGPPSGGLSLTLPDTQWDWYIYLHLVYFYGKCR